MGQYFFEICNIFSDAGYEVCVHMTKGKNDAAEYAFNHGAQFDRVVCCGGDGTLNETVNGLARLETRPPLGYITAGTVNDVGYSLGLSFDPVEAARTAVGGDMFDWDVGLFCKERYFCYVAAFGLFTDVTYETPQNAKNIWGRAAYLMEGARRLGKIPAFHTVVNCDGEIHEGDYILGMVTNTLSIGGFRTIYGSLPSLNDGLFELALVKSPTTVAEFQHIVSIMLQLESADTVNSPFLQVLRGKRISFEFDADVKWTLDGEFGGLLKSATAENLQRHLKILTKKQ